MTGTSGTTAAAGTSAVAGPARARSYTRPVATTVDATAAPPGSRRRVLPAIWFPIALFAVWRVAAALVTAHAFNQSWMAPTLRWDAGNYIVLTNQGYYDAADFQPVTAFFPFVAWCAKALRVVVRDDLWTFVLVANAAALAAFVAVWAAVREWRDEATARWAIVLLALFPSSFFLWSFYSEAAFVALGAGAVWAARRRLDWLAAALLTGVAATRTVGILVAAVLVISHLWRERRIDRAVVLYALGGVLGLALVMGQMWYQMDDPLQWLEVQDDWGRELAPPWEAIENGWESISDDSIPEFAPRAEFKAKIVDFVSVWLVLVAAVVAAWPRRDPARRWPTETWLLIVALAALPLSSTLLYSFNRFTLSNWPVFAVYAGVLVAATRRTRLAWVPVAALAGFLLVVDYQLLGHWARYNFLG